MKYDEINYWSEMKLDIIKEYAGAYSKIMTAQLKPPLYHVYIDAFAGAGIHISKSTGEFVPGSPLNALLINPPFKEYHLIDLDGEKVGSLRRIAKDYQDVTIYEGDCNNLLVEKVLPRANYNEYKRALCILDPYGLHLNWEVIKLAGQMKSIEIFLNFPVADMNRNVLWRNPDKVDPQQAARMTAFWGDETWRQAAYNTTGNLFGWEEKTDNDSVAQAFRLRLKKDAGFKYVPEPVPMRNSVGAIVYYLFFASQKPVAANIITYIFNIYKDRGSSGT
jgi:three-Cys-motif partner protein